MLTEVCSAGFPHSEICGSMDICSSPQLIAAYHVFLRLSVPRHPPCALISLIIKANFPCESCDLLGMSISSIFNRLIFFVCKYVFRHIYWMSFLSVLENIVQIFSYCMQFSRYSIIFRLLLTVSSHNIQEDFFLYLITRNIFIFYQSGTHLLSHAVSSIVPSAA